MKGAILYIEDDLEIGELVTEDLQRRGYSVNWQTSSEQYHDGIVEIDLVILDIMLPGLDGFTIGERIRASRRDLPILFLTARTAIEDKLKGLEYADDYLTKPFHPDELAARLEVLLRRFDKTHSDIIQIRHIQFDRRTQQITNLMSQEEIRLTEKQFKIFLYFLRHPNQIMTKEQIYEEIWQQDYIEGDKTLAVHIRYLRQKLELDPQNPEIIETVRGIGYRVKQ
ncbi:response regulator transcription factor [Paenibacillus sp. YPG26]|uniref:response regulator transcription factor n=1 Tax=Paenibacillus sp. YPG26 TaxID=2878915 RepID=UPI00203EAB39|nr:response regulator transcription factor [Paenibacillus sp. YPG26]USB33162.1 response regulator transcription factor [Paenibacillus sp. YPG26]